jgi:hypothetical protein
MKKKKKKEKKIVVHKFCDVDTEKKLNQRNKGKRGQNFNHSSPTITNTLIISISSHYLRREREKTCL